MGELQNNIHTAKNLLIFLLSAVTLCQESAPVLRDGPGFTVTRPAHQVTTARAAESCVFVLMEPTVMASLELVSVHQDT